MTPRFALDLSFDGITLLERLEAGWARIGAVELHDPAAMTRGLTGLRSEAQRRAPGGFTTILVIPAAEVLYTDVTVTAPDHDGERAEIRAALEGCTPYALDDLAFDWERDGDRARVAVVARETLEQAEDIARRHRFNPAAFTAAPDAAQFPRAPDFGTSSLLDTLLADGASLAPDRAVIREGARPDPAPQADPVPQDATEAGGAAATDGASPVPAAAARTAPGAPADEGPESSASGLFERARSWIGSASTRSEVASAATEAAADEPVAGTGAAKAPPQPGPTRQEGAAKAAAAETTAKAPAATDKAPDASTVAELPAAQTPLKKPAATPAETAPELTPLRAAASGGKAKAGAGRTAIDATEARDDAAPATAQDKRETSDAGTAETATAAGASSGPGAAPAKPAAAPAKGQTRKARGRKGKHGPAGARPARTAGASSGRRRTGTPPATAHPPEPRRLTLAAGMGEGDEPVTVFGAAAAQRARRRRRVAVASGTSLLLAAAAGLWAVSLWHETRLDELRTTPPLAQFDAPTGPAAGDFAALEAPRLAPLDAPRPPLGAPDPAVVPQTTIAAPRVVEPIQPFTEQALFGGGIAARTPQVAFARQRFDVVFGEPALLPPARPGPTAGTETAEAPAADPLERLDGGGILAATPEIAFAPAGAEIAVLEGEPPLLPEPRDTPLEAADIAAAITAVTPSAPAEAPVEIEVIAGEPPILPEPRGPVADAADIAAVTPDTPEAPVEIEVIAGAPPVLPAQRSIAAAPAPEPGLDAAALIAATPQAAFDARRATPETDIVIASDPALAEFRPQPRPESVTDTAGDEEARAVTAAAIADAADPAEIAATPPARPDELAGADPDATDADTAPFASATPNAVASAPRPDARPQDFAESDAVQRAARAAAEEAARAVASEPVTGPSSPAATAPTPSAPNIPLAADVAEAATNSGMLNLRQINLIGVYGGASDRRALVRMSNGRMVRVGVGDELDGGEVAAIDDSALRYVRRGRDHILRVGGDS